MAYYAARGARVTLVTCTLGEEGEIHVPELALLAPAEADQLGGYRIAELAAACAALGVTDHRFLGGAGRYRDSGMTGTPSNDHPRAFWGAGLDAAAGHLVSVIRETKPQVVGTYDPNGFYGHPGHIQAHQVAKVYWTAVPRSVLAAGMEHFSASADNPFAGVSDVSELPFGTPDDDVAARIDGTDHAEAKTAALRAHATQIPPNSWLFSLAGAAGEETLGVEYYVLAEGRRGPGTGPYGLEDDLFAGLGVVVPATVSG